ncbi:hypothetical protein FOA52_001528 [Chlamydomonas sp. UWO 241]|nr:hypothetical protein FOA52_001528 [Chlamydomonas sp. UWO 241]
MSSPMSSPRAPRAGTVMREREVTRNVNEPLARARARAAASAQPCAEMFRSMSEFDVGLLVGAGSFGRVHVAKHKISGRLVAIKSVSKASIVEAKQVRHIIDERSIVIQMQQAPFIVPLLGSFQDAACVFFVMEFIYGGDLYALACTQGGRSARFYAAQVILSLEFLHPRGIMHRDIKPENLLIAGDGYLRLTDLGFAKVVNGRTYTLCGTPDYMALEVVRRRMVPGWKEGYTLDAAWWSLGCLVFEMLSGVPPFYTGGTAADTYVKILDPASLSTLSMAHFSPAARDLVTRLLRDAPPFRPTLDERDPAANFGALKAVQPLSHPLVLTPQKQAQFKCC